MKKLVPAQPIEPRWIAALMILVVLGLLTALPDRVRFVPVWIPYIPGLAVLAAMAMVPLTGGKTRWLRLERIVLLVFCVLMGIATLVSLTYLIYEMINRSTVLDGLQLLTSSIAVWSVNVLIFSLLYWQIDLGGPEARINHRQSQPDWLFPQGSLPEDVMPNWRPTFIDYLFLSYNTATAFSPTDTLPLTIRAKLLMMLQSIISLVTILVVVSRAINIIGS
jgi:uncharacterized membrane protein